METLKQFISYNNDYETIRNLFVNLDEKMKFAHQEGYSAAINSSIKIENGVPDFSSYSQRLTEEIRKQNIVDLCKLAMGTYFSLPTGTFCDYTNFPTEYIQNNFDFLVSGLSESDADYYRDVIMNGNITYFSDYLKQVKENNSSSKGSSNRVRTYATPIGKAMSNKDDNAFIDLAFYPIIISLAAVMSYMVYILIS